MNTPERNDKNVEKLNKTGKVYKETEDDKKREEAYKAVLEEVTRQYPLPTARTFSIVACIAFWIFCVIGLLFGVDLRGIMPFLFVMLAIVAVLHIPVFYLKKKILDVIMALLFAAGCIGVAISMIVRF
ncbi:MAG: hypothetical protein FWG45_01520 [Oscillospiraceae bacterium]|nr:hypothetical protein [Oscillospiraceae bacterium]